MRAERLAPRDMTILADLAELHVRQGDRPAAATYYRRMADCAEGSDRDYALRRLCELEEKEGYFADTDTVAARAVLRGMPFGVVENRRESFDGRANFIRTERNVKKDLL